MKLLTMLLLLFLNPIPEEEKTPIYQNTSYTSAAGECLEISEPEASYHTSQPVQPAPQYHQKVLDYLSTHPTITRPQAERLLTVSQATAARLLARMTSEGSLQRLGQGRDTYYQLPR